MTLAEDMRGHNSRPFGEDEPRSLTKEDKLRFLHEAAITARALANVAQVTKKEILGKRQGKRGWVLRCIWEDFLISRGCPKKLIARIIEVERDVPGDDERRIWAWRDDDTIDGRIHFAQGYLDQTILLSDEIDEIVGMICAEEKAPKVQEEEVEEAPPPPPPPAKKAPYVPGVDPKPEILRRRQEAEAIVAKKNFEARDEYLTGRIAACKNLIIIGGKAKATKDQRENAKGAVRDLEKYMQERKLLRKAWKQRTPHESEALVI